jgi:hypothetical protein
MKRLEKQREKAERRAQKRLANRTQKHLPTDGTSPAGDESGAAVGADPPESTPQN